MILNNKTKHMLLVIAAITLSGIIGRVIQK